MRNKFATVKLSDVLFMLAMIMVLAFPTPSIFKALAIIAFFCYMMVIKVMHYRSIKNNLHIFASFLFLGYAYLSKYWALHPEAISVQINNVLWSVMLSTAISTYVIYRELNVKDIAVRLVPIVLVFVVNVMINGSYREDDRLSIGINENAFGRLCSGMACFFFFRWKQERGKNIVTDILAVVLSLFSFMSGSRTAVMILGIYVLAFLVFEHSSQNGIKLLGRILMIVGLCVAAYLCLIHIEFLYSTIGYRVETMLFAFMGMAEGDGSYVTRVKMMETAKEIFLEYPLFGIGMNNFAFATYYQAYAHSNYYELAACLGIVGLTIYYVPFLIYAKRAVSQWRKDLPEMIVPLAVLLAFLLNDIGSVSYFSMVSHSFAGIAIGLLLKPSRSIELRR